MKKNLKKILILLILFVLAAAGYFTVLMQLREDERSIPRLRTRTFQSLMEYSWGGG